MLERTRGPASFLRQVTVKLDVKRRMEKHYQWQVQSQLYKSTRNGSRIQRFGPSCLVCHLSWCLILNLCTPSFTNPIFLYSLNNYTYYFLFWIDSAHESPEHSSVENYKDSLPFWGRSHLSFTYPSSMADFFKFDTVHTAFKRTSQGKCYLCKNPPTYFSLRLCLILLNS